MWTMLPSHLLYRVLNDNCNTPTKKDCTQATDKPSKIALLKWFVQAADTYQKNKNPTATHACGPLCTSRLYTCHGKRHEFYKCFSSGNELRSASGYTSDPVAMSSTGEEGTCRYPHVHKGLSTLINIWLASIQSASLFATGANEDTQLLLQHTSMMR